MIYVQYDTFVRYICKIRNLCVVQNLLCGKRSMYGTRSLFRTRSSYSTKSANRKIKLCKNQYVHLGPLYFKSTMVLNEHNLYIKFIFGNILMFEQSLLQNQSLVHTPNNPLLYLHLHWNVVYLLIYLVQVLALMMNPFYELLYHTSLLL